MKRSCYLENAVCQAPRCARGDYMLEVQHQRGEEASSSFGAKGFISWSPMSLLFPPCNFLFFGFEELFVKGIPYKAH